MRNVEIFPLIIFNVEKWQRQLCNECSGDLCEIEYVVPFGYLSDRGLVHLPLCFSALRCKQNTHKCVSGKYFAMIQQEQQLLVCNRSATPVKLAGKCPNVPLVNKPLTLNNQRHVIEVVHIYIWDI